MNTFLKNALRRCNNKLKIEIDRLPPEGLHSLPDKLWPFIWFFIRQVKLPIISIAVAEGIAAFLISTMFWYVGELVKRSEFGTAMLVAGLALLIARFVMDNITEIFNHLIFTPYFGDLIRRQLYWYTARQSLAFFQNDFAGRIANKLLQSAPSLRNAVYDIIGAVWYASVFTVSNLYFLAKINPVLAAPLAAWMACYILVLKFFIPRIQKYSTIHADDMSTLTGQIVDSFTNFLPVKYFARTHHEDQRIVKLLKKHSESMRGSTSSIWLMGLVIDLLNMALLTVTALAGLWLIEKQGQIGMAAMAMALPMVLQATFQSGWIMFTVSGIFENLGTVQEGIEILTRPHEVTDASNATELKTARKKSAAINYRNVHFNYGKQNDASEKPVLENFNLNIPAGQKLGIVGRSGSGKSTITSLIVRAYDVEGGEILIDGQNIARVTQDSLRRQITVVTQESYLFHRSIIDNIRYGKPDASIEEVVEAAKRAHAHSFITGLADNAGRKGYEAHVGERGIKLSGGQKQRIGIARAILKDAPILILDEATSALDSESEQAIQQALEGIMEDKTVIAIAHRLSTLRHMDRIIVMDSGKIIEDSAHDKLIRKQDGHYAKLWKMQSGGFM